eukprot:2504711-Amphidinium_carterae.1
MREARAQVVAGVSGPVLPAEKRTAKKCSGKYPCLIVRPLGCPLQESLLTASRLRVQKRTAT